MTQAKEERSQRSVQDEDDRGDVCWMEACEGIARSLLKFLEDRESAKVNKSCLQTNQGSLLCEMRGKQEMTKTVVSDLQTRRK